MLKSKNKNAGNEFSIVSAITEMMKSKNKNAGNEFSVVSAITENAEIKK